MDEFILPTEPDFKIYKDRAIYVGTFLGGPLVAGYLIAENFKLLGQKRKVGTTWAVAIAATILIFGSVFLIPNAEKIPNYIVPILYTALAQFLVQKYQGAAIKAHIESGGQTFSIWRATWIGFVGLAFLLIVIFAIVMVTNSYSGN